ncbi:hypothetical protein E4U60_005005 [Claviceps pazoutovae]|uniref:Uncharacterized protein n=1 Tax=Claviceps pazoutovae TaxID=1649127 RepID=A0A9P7M8E2_9HYPO|nr:hypothetical protein E4U60_005005 [Claviceps pazoutovae]
MKFSAILGSLAIYGLQVHAIPTDLDPQAIEPIEASSPIPNTLEARDTYCCVGLKSSTTQITKFIPRGVGTYQWFPSNDVNDCLVYVKRNPNNCNGWTFKTITCDDLGPQINIAIRPAGDCRR